MNEPVLGSVSSHRSVNQAPVPYTPSWMDRFMQAIERLPGSYWTAYLLLFVVESIIVHGAAWLDGTLPLWQLQPLFLLFPIWTWFPLAVMTFLNHQAIAALERFRPLLPSTEEIAQLTYRFTTMPARPVLIGNFVALTYFLFLVFYRPLEPYHNRPLLTPVYVASGIGAFAMGAIIYLHSFRQLLMVHRMYVGVHTFNIFQMEPIYAFSRLTALTAGAYILLISMTLLLFPFPIGDIRAVVSYLLQILVVIPAFVLPLWHAHQRLAAEKRRLQSEADQRLEALLHQFHHTLNSLDSNVLPTIRTGIETLLIERKLLAEMPTWPWPSATIKGLLSALFLPILLFLLQQIIERWLTL